MKFSYDINGLRSYIFGMPWLDETLPEILRLPKRITSNLPLSVKNLCKNLSGMRLRFQFEGRHLILRCKLGRSSMMKHFTHIGQSGFDVYVNGKLVGVIDQYRKVKYKLDLNTLKPKSKIKNVEINFPLYNGLNDLILETDKEIKPAAPFINENPIYYYGSSITQGGCASRPGNSYQAMISRELNMDFVNLGFSGNGMGYLDIAKGISEKPAYAFVLDWGLNLIKENDSLSILKRRYEEFIKILRKKHAFTPILIVNLQYTIHDYMNNGEGILVEYRTHIHSVYEKLKENGDKGIFYIEGKDIIGPDHIDGTVDGTHPNDYGFYLYYQKISEILKDEIIPYVKTRSSSNSQ